MKPILYVVVWFGLGLQLASCAWGQTAADFGQWTAVFAQGDLATRGDLAGRGDLATRIDLATRGEESPSLKWWFDGHLRLMDDTGGYQQSIIRPGIGRRLGERTTLWAGYAWVHTESLSGLEYDEHRLWQQSTWSLDHQSWTFALRSRLEERFLETGDDLGWRFRQLVRLQHQMPAFPRLGLVFWDEAFFNLNDTDWGAQTGFDQNRAFGGFAWKRSPESRWRVEIGYLNHALDIPNGNDRTHHLLSVNFFH